LAGPACGACMPVAHARRPDRPCPGSPPSSPPNSSSSIPPTGPSDSPHRSAQPPATSTPITSRRRRLRRPHHRRRSRTPQPTGRQLSLAASVRTGQPAQLVIAGAGLDGELSVATIAERLADLGAESLPDLDAAAVAPATSSAGNPPKPPGSSPQPPRATAASSKSATPPTAISQPSYGRVPPLQGIPQARCLLSTRASHHLGATATCQNLSTICGVEILTSRLRLNRTAHRPFTGGSEPCHELAG
jgi:hypothetical protein